MTDITTIRYKNEFQIFADVKRKRQYLLRGSVLITFLNINRIQRSKNTIKRHMMQGLAHHLVASFPFSMVMNILSLEFFEEE